MTWTKGQFVDRAYEELALAGYEFDISPEEKQSGLSKLESLMATWSAQGMTLPYSFSEDPNQNETSGLPLVANEAVYLALAQRIAASKGKSLNPSTQAAASEAKSSLLTWLMHQQVQEQQQPNGMPRGAGQKTWRSTQRPFYSEPDTNPLQTSGSGGLTLPGG